MAVMTNPSRKPAVDPGRLELFFEKVKNESPGNGGNTVCWLPSIPRGIRGYRRSMAFSRRKKRVFPHLIRPRAGGLNRTISGILTAGKKESIVVKRRRTGSRRERFMAAASLTGKQPGKRTYLRRPVFFIPGQQLSRDTGCPG
jgi:hypothetical protein